MSAQLDALSTEHLHRDLKGRSVRSPRRQLPYYIHLNSSPGAPADFGLVAIATAITGLGQAFADLCLSEATIQQEDINHHQVSTLFWINVAIGLTLMLITVGLAPVLAWFYREPRLKDIALVLSSTFLIGSLRVQHEALLKRQMRFASVAIRDVVSAALGVSIAIIMAWRGAGYWAVVAFPVAAQFTRMALSWLAYDGYRADPDETLMLVP